mgnify:CR=1 FL=1
MTLGAPEVEKILRSIVRDTEATLVRVKLNEKKRKAKLYLRVDEHSQLEEADRRVQRLAYRYTGWKTKVLEHTETALIHGGKLVQNNRFFSWSNHEESSFSCYKNHNGWRVSQRWYTPLPVLASFSEWCLSMSVGEQLEL